MMLVLLLSAVCFLAYANGANDNFKGVASLFGSGAATYRTALAWATLTTLAGSICALFLAQTLLIKFSGKGLAPDALIQAPPFMLAVAGGAGSTVILATRLGFPVSTTHALLGAMLGGSLLATGGDISFAPLLKQFVLPLLLSPVLALLLAALLFRGLMASRSGTAGDDAICLCLEPVNEPVSHAAASAVALNTPAFLVGRQDDCRQSNAVPLVGIDTRRLIDTLHFCGAGAVCFARGLNDTPKIAALLLLAPGFHAPTIIGVVAVAMMLGGLLHARRVAETMSHKITRISHDQGLSANLTTAALVLFASNLGLPVSTTHVSVGALFGIGLAGGQANGGTIVSILWSWLLTLPCAALYAALIYSATSGF